MNRTNRTNNFTNTIPPGWISDQASRTQVVCPTLLESLLFLPFFFSKYSQHFLGFLFQMELFLVRFFIWLKETNWD